MKNRTLVVRPDDDSDCLRTRSVLTGRFSGQRYRSVTKLSATDRPYGRKSTVEDATPGWMCTVVVALALYK